MNTELIGKRLLSLRGDKSQEQVANDLGLSTSAIGMYERGERVPKDEIKLQIADYYGLSVQEIFFDQQ